MKHKGPEIVGFDPQTYLWFSSEGRAVQRLHASEESDVLLVCWEPGQGTSYHDHGISESLVIILEGELGFRSHDEERTARPFEVLICPRGAAHQMRNASKSRAVTLHVYSPPLVGPVSHPYIDKSAANPERVRERARQPRRAGDSE